MKNILILAVVAADIFKANPALEKFHQTSDGQAFYNDSDARLHAKTLKDKTVKVVNKGDAQATAAEDKKVKPASATDVIAAIEAAETLEALEAYKGDTRATVVAAFEKKTAELTKPAE